MVVIFNIVIVGEFNINFLLIDEFLDKKIKVEIIRLNCVMD